MQYRAYGYRAAQGVARYYDSTTEALKGLHARVYLETSLRDVRLLLRRPRPTAVKLTLRHEKQIEFLRYLLDMLPTETIIEEFKKPEPPRTEKDRWC